MPDDTHDSLTVHITVAWWLRWYLMGVVLMCRMTGCAPNMQRVEHWVMRSITMRIE